ncbi:MAG: hypothetical protein ABSE64_00285 [Vulcanimicrobiaceae bacterium]
MSAAASGAVRDDGLTRTTLRIGTNLPAASVAQVVHALQRVPGVLTADADAENAQAFVAHDAAVPPASLVAAASCAGTAASIVVAPTPPSAASVEVNDAPRRVQRRQLIIVAMVAMLALVIIDIAFPESSDKHWFFVMPVILVWTFILLRATLSRKS